MIAFFFILVILDSLKDIGVESTEISCYGIPYNRSDVCSGHGSCIGSNICNCSLGYGAKRCNFWECDGRSYYDDPCSGRGSCEMPETCDCDSHYIGTTCSVTFCDAIMGNSSSVCSGHGDCFEYNNCDCLGDYDPSSFCSSWVCGSYDKDDYRACSRHGNCKISSTTHESYCVCEDGYYDSDVYGDCADWKCFGILDWSFSVCNGHGNCDGPDDCDCAYGYNVGEECGWTCGGISHDDSEVCSGNGKCVDVNHCVCSHKSFHAETFCATWECYGYDSDDDGACSGKGQCVSADECICDKGYSELSCSVLEITCFGIRAEDPDVCGGKGTCVSVDDCVCEAFTEVKDGKCQSSDDDYDTGDLIRDSIIIASILIIVSPFFLACCLYCLCCCVAVCLLVCALAAPSLFAECLCCCCFPLFRKRQQRKLDKYKKLLINDDDENDDEDINNNLAKIRVNTNLFKINYEELKLDQIIGSGGSDATIYKATWLKNTIAFKKFQTRDIVSSQDNFSVFEGEVSVLSSVRHPNILHFYGATLKPCGIVMEYCENGDLRNFLLSKKFEKEMEQTNVESVPVIPVKEKMRISMEICNALNYLHTRNIIHRDLKCENVLIDDHHSTKVTDFGLSKLVSLGDSQHTRRIGTMIYMAPELVGGHYSEKVDIYSFGILLFVLFTLNFDPYGKNETLVELRVSEDPNYRPEVSELSVLVENDLAQFIAGLCVNCWSHDPDDRKTFEELCSCFEEKIKEKNL